MRWWSPALSCGKGPAEGEQWWPDALPKWKSQERANSDSPMALCQGKTPKKDKQWQTSSPSQKEGPRESKRWFLWFFSWATAQFTGIVVIVLLYCRHCWQHRPCSLNVFCICWVLISGCRRLNLLFSRFDPDRSRPIQTAKDCDPNQ